VFDIHARELDLYDSGSGIVSYDGTKRHAILNPSNSGAAAICTATVFDAYNVSVTLAITGVVNSGTTVRIDGIHYNTEPYFTLEGSPNFAVSIWASGTYEITTRCSCNQNVATTRTTIRCWLERSAGGGAFAEIPGSRHWLYCRNTTNGYDTSLCTIILEDLAPGDKFRLQMGQDGTVNLGVVAPANSCGLTFEKLE
jgi:hypothetical protein